MDDYQMDDDQMDEDQMDCNQMDDYQMDDDQMDGDQMDSNQMDDDQIDGDQMDGDQMDGDQMDGDQMDDSIVELKRRVEGRDFVGPLPVENWPQGHFGHGGGEVDGPPSPGGRLGGREGEGAVVGESLVGEVCLGPGGELKFRNKKL